MAEQNALSIAQYYGSLLILQYVGQPKAFQTVQDTAGLAVMFQDVDGSPAGSLTSLPIAVLNGFNINPTIQAFYLSAVPVSGVVEFCYYGNNLTALTLSGASAAEIAADIAVGLGSDFSVKVTGSWQDRLVVVEFLNPTTPAVFTTFNNLLDADGSPVVLTTVTNQAVGAQLDVLGKYAGVTRSGFGPHGPITLDDVDFRKLIQMAIATNNSGSSLKDIVDVLYRFFPGQIRLIDQAHTAPMNMTYVISQNIGSADLLALFISEGLLPKPMAVGIAVIAPPQVSNIFGYCDYERATPTDPNTTVVAPYNNHVSYDNGGVDTGDIYMDYDYSVE